jgi:hypothetical protein
MRFLRCFGATLLFLLAAALGGFACLQAGATLGWNYLHVDRLLAARSVAFTIGGPFFTLIAMLVARGKGRFSNLGLLGIPVALAGFGLALSAMVTANLHPEQGVAPALGAFVAYVLAAVLLSGRDRAVG